MDCIMKLCKTLISEPTWLLYGQTWSSSYSRYASASVQLNLNLPAACKHLRFLAAAAQATQNSSRLAGCAVSRSPWPVSSRATANPFLCCSSLVACKDSVSAMLKRAFQSISWDYCCASLHMLLAKLGCLA